MPCSGTHRENVVEGGQETPGGGVSWSRWKEQGIDGKIWTGEAGTDQDEVKYITGDLCSPLGVTGLSK